MITKIFDWISHPTWSDTDPMDWVAGLALILILCFFWTRVLKNVLA